MMLLLVFFNDCGSILTIYSHRSKCFLKSANNFAHGFKCKYFRSSNFFFGILYVCWMNTFSIDINGFWLHKLALYICEEFCFKSNYFHKTQLDLFNIEFFSRFSQHWTNCICNGKSLQIFVTFHSEWWTYAVKHSHEMITRRRDESHLKQKS